MNHHYHGLFFALFALLFTSEITTAHMSNHLLTEEKITVEGDPLKVIEHTLPNGMKLYMSVNKNEPRISTNIVVRAGSKHDPAETTGLAHYLEHMMFKGTSKIASLDWEKEQVLLDEIARLYEEHRQTSDPIKRKDIYSKIDSVSNEAGKLAAANEYDKMVGSIGAKGTNAYTWVEQTVYVNDIPANELEKWMELESERFQEVVLRLFHTELEAVFEEFNINQDRDFRKTMKAMTETLFPSHPYGTQTTIGEGEHLKNPSHYAIYKYFNTYYVPNNMAIVLAGDFDPQEVIEFAEKYWGDYDAQKVPAFEYEKQAELQKRVEKTVYGQESQYLDMAWRFPGAASDDALKLQLIKGLLYNRQAGIIDLDINAKQRLLEADAWNWIFEDYSVIGMSGKPKENQKLADVERILLESIDKLHNGNFPDWLIDAVIKNMKLNDLRAEKNNNARVYKMTNAFIKGLNWEEVVNQYDRMAEFSKQEIIDCAKKYIRKDNFVVVYKKEGEDPNVMEVEKPAITPVELVRDQKSDWASDWMAKESPGLEPQFLDFDQDMEKSTAYKEGVEIRKIENSNGAFTLLYIYEMGKNADKQLDLAMQYLPYLGTEKYTAEELQQELYKRGLEFNAYNRDERIYMMLSGLEESLEQGIQLFDHILNEAKADEDAMDNLVNDMLTTRANDKKDKRKILRSALYNYAKYGENSAYTNVLTTEELERIEAQGLVDKIHQLKNYEHNIFFYGNTDLDELVEIMKAERHLPQDLQPVKQNKEFKERATYGNKVFFVDFPMVQAEIMLLSKGTEGFSLDEYIRSDFYNTYFGFGLSSIVFQEIRESRALAYSAYAYNGNPNEPDEAHYMTAYVGTQADKMPAAIEGMKEIIQDMPLVEEQVETARQSIMKKIETDRITDASIYWTYRKNEKLGYPRDLRKDVYKFIQTATLEDLKEFHAEKIKGRKFDMLVMADKEEIDMEYLESQGEVVELSLQEVFGY